MPEIPGNNSVRGSKVPGRGSIPPRWPGLESSAGAGGATGPLAIGLGNEAAQKAAQKAARFFGFHNEASIMARLAGMGISPTMGNLRIAQQLLRYGQGLEQEMILSLANLWSQVGEGDVSKLEALVVLQANNLPVNGQNLQAVLQLLTGGPLSHLLARLTMAIKGEQNQKLAGLGKHLNAFWQQGHLDKDMIKQLGEFQKNLAGLGDELAKVDPRGLSDGTVDELGRLSDLFAAHKLLAEQGPNPAQYLPFFVWRDQQPMPAEIIVQNEGGGGEVGAGGFMRVTLAVETKNLGRITVDITYVREHLNARFEVAEDKIKKLVDTRMVLLRQRLVACPYIVDILGCQAVGNARAISALLPKRRDLKKLSRAQGIL
jgi:hypothetical protein